MDPSRHVPGKTDGTRPDKTGSNELDSPIPPNLVLALDEGRTTSHLAIFQMNELQRGSMNTSMKAITAAVLAAGLTVTSVYAADATPPAKKHKHTAAKPAATNATADQLQDLKREMQNQIDSLKNELSDRDAKLRQAQEAAAAAQAAATRAEAAANSQSQAVSDNAAAVSTLDATVTDLKANAAQVATQIQDDQVKIKKAIENPDVLHYKGVTITPGGYFAGESIYRTHATGADEPTPFNAIPYEHADAYHLSEFYAGARHSRLSMLVQGKSDIGNLRGYVEADFLGTGTSSNPNQSNSYVLRQRVFWGQLETPSHYTISAGQLWSFATETKKGMSTLSGDIATPQVIDPNYVPGFVWTRQYAFRVTKSFSKAAFGVSIENPEFLYSATLAGNTPYAVLGNQGANGGNYNAAVSGCSNSSYTAYSESGGKVSVGTKFLNICSNLANYTFNQAPDLIVKAAFDPGFGHYEVFGIGRFAHETIFPGVTNNAYLYGGVTDTKGVTVAPLTSAGAYNNSAILGGVGASGRISILKKKLDLGAKGLYGEGVGRYGNSTLSDLTAKPDGTFAALRNTSFITTAEWTATPRLVLYFNYGGDFVDRVAYVTSTITGVTKYDPSTQTITYKIGNAPVGYGSALSSNAGCKTDGNPSYTGVGFYPAGSCGSATHSVQEYTGGYWYDLYRGPAGRVRQGIQYGYAVRQGVSDTTGIAGKGIENMVWTSFRYFLP